MRMLQLLPLRRTIMRSVSARHGVLTGIVALVFATAPLPTLSQLSHSPALAQSKDSQESLIRNAWAEGGLLPLDIQSGSRNPKNRKRISSATPGRKAERPRSIRC